MFIKEENQEFPKEEVMKFSWEDNSDGVGIAWLEKETELWHVKKGFMSYGAFTKGLAKLRKEWDLDNKRVIVHFRAGTTGKNMGQACHPFPGLNATKKTVELTSYTCKSVVFHNGTVGPGTNLLSDTQHAVIKDASPLIKHMFSNKDEATGVYEIDDGLSDISNRLLKGGMCRWAITYGNTILLLGAWEEEKETGLYWSNDRYVKERTRKYVAEMNRKAAVQNAKTKTQTYAGTISGPTTIWLNSHTLNKKGKLEKYINKDTGLWDWSAWHTRNMIDKGTPNPVKTEKDDGFHKVYDENNVLLFEVSK